jgi:spore germination cell wall hydrolase CwlJ-like protein
MSAVALNLPALRLPAVLREHWLSMSVLGVTVLLYVLAALSLAVGGGAVSPAGGGGRSETAPVRLAGAPPAPEPLAFRPLAPTDAVAINAAIPIAGGPNPAARAFALPTASDIDRMRAVDCLTQTIYYEAANEPTDGQRAVAQVVLNRVRHPAYPNTVCGVVYQGSTRATGCQFTFTCDGSLRRVPSTSGWARARAVAEAALAGSVYAPVGWATHYHANYVVPYWSSSLTKAAEIGTHIFYRWAGGWGRAPAFSSRHPGSEPAINRSAVLAAQEQARAAAAAAAAAAVSAETVAPGLPVPGVTPPLATPAEMANRPVVRRYEPLRRDSAVEVMNQRGASSLSAEQRWALTGQQSDSPQTALGTREPRSLPPVLEGVRVRRRAEAPAAEAPASPAPSPATTSATETR